MAWQTEHGQVKLATANLEHAGVCLLAIAQISSKGPHCSFAMRHAAHDTCVHMHMAQADQAESLWRIKPITIAANFIT